MGTGTSNLRKHLNKKHLKVYDQAIVDYYWDYKTSTTQSNDASVHNTIDAAA